MRRIVYDHDRKGYFFEDTGKEMKPTEENVRKIDAYDLFGCRGRQHNQSIIMRGYSFEYGDGEYEPIFSWFKNHMSLFPPELTRILSA